MLSMKALDVVHYHVSIGGLPGPILVVYPMMPTHVYCAKITFSVNGATSASPSIFDGDLPASGGEDDSSNDDHVNEEGQLPEAPTRAPL